MAARALGRGERYREPDGAAAGLLAQGALRGAGRTQPAFRPRASPGGELPRGERGDPSHAQLHGRLRELAQASKASLFMVLQAGLAALLSRLGGGEDIPIGTPIAGRGESALENLVGFFVNTLVLRTDVSGDPSFRELLARIRGFDLDAYGQQDVPFERVVEALQPARSLARHPLFQVMLVLQNAPNPELALAGLALYPEPALLNVAKFDLTLSLGERLGPGGQPLGIEGGLEYSVDLFDEGSVQSMAERFVRLLAAAAATPDAPLHRLEILDAQERHMLLEEFNDTARPLPEARCPNSLRRRWRTPQRSPWSLARSPSPIKSSTRAPTPWPIT